MSDKIQILNGNKVYLKKLSEADFDDKYLDWMNNPEITRFLLCGPDKKFTKKELIEYISNINQSKSDYLFGIYIQKNDKYIGNIKLSNTDALEGADIGMIIGDKSEWGKGYSTDAIACIVKFAFIKIGLKKIIAGVVELNQGSLKSFIKNDFFIEKTKETIFEGKSIKSHILARENR